MNSKKISFNINNLKIEENQKKKFNILRSKTLAVPYKINKLLTRSMNIQKCFQIMKLLRSNRGINDVENCKILFKTFNSFLSYISLNNDREETESLLSEIAWVIFHKKLKKNTLIKKTGEKNEFFYLVMTGKVQKVSVVFKKEKITLKEYLIYLLKMKLIKEYEVLKKCRQMNKSIMNINYENIEYFCEKNPKYNYLELLKIATDEIKNLGFDLRKINHNDEYKEIPSIQNYLDVGEIKKDIKSQINKGPTIYLYIPKYELSCALTKGDYFGFLTKDIFTEFSSYICLEDCDLGYINKNKIIESSIFEQIDLTLSKYFSINKNRYYIFKDIDDKIFMEKYSSFINYQKYKKGDKIFLQGGINEGIYLIKDGEISISSYTHLNDLTKLMLNLICSLKGFQEHVPPSEYKNIVKENNDNNNNSIKGIISYEDDKTNFDFGILKCGDILGLNELYDYNTSRYNFSAECISNEANVFFINKNNFNLILGKEKSLYCSVIKKVELRIKYLIGCIKNFRKHMPVDINKKPKNEMSKIEQNNIYNIYNNKPFIGENLKSNFNYKYWNNNKNIAINSNKITEENISPIKTNSRNKSTVNFNTINNIPNIREKIMKKNEFVLKSQDMIKHDIIYNKNSNNDFNKYISVNILKYFSNKKPTFLENYSTDNKLTKNKTYNSLIGSKSYKDNCKIYNFTTPNSNIKNNSNLIFNNTFDNKNNKLPLLVNNLKKGNFVKNNKQCKTIYFL